MKQCSRHCPVRTPAPAGRPSWGCIRPVGADSVWITGQGAGPKGSRLWQWYPAGPSSRGEADMPPRSSRPNEPGNYRRREGSELKPRPPIEHLAPAEPAESMQVTIVVRRRTDGLAIPDHAYYAKTPPSKRRRLPPEEFASKYGAADDDLAAVRRFAESHGLAVLDSNAARRSIVVSGTVAQFNETFAITLNTYRHQVRRSQLDAEPRAETFRSYDGFVSVPADLADV